MGKNSKGETKEKSGRTEREKRGGKEGGKGGGKGRGMRVGEQVKVRGEDGASLEGRLHCRRERSSEVFTRAPMQHGNWVSHCNNARHGVNALAVGVMITFFESFYCYKNDWMIYA